MSVIVVDCACGRHDAFLSKRHAEKAAKGSYNGERASTYPCGAGWHYGKPIPPPEQKTRMTIEQMYEWARRVRGLDQPQEHVAA